MGVSLIHRFFFKKTIKNLCVFKRPMFGSALNLVGPRICGPSGLGLKVHSLQDFAIRGAGAEGLGRVGYGSSDRLLSFLHRCCENNSRSWDLGVGMYPGSVVRKGVQRLQCVNGQGQTKEN